MLQLINIKKSYKTKDFVQHALNGVSISFRKNEFASILGASGSGKTTMLNIIGGLDQYDEGDLVIDGVSTKKYKESSWDTYRNNRVGFVFQSYNLIPHQSVLSNVELALTLSGVTKAKRKERAIEALKNVGLEDHIYKLPTQLSGGQMQRVAIARALINDPEIVLADEPTGALDSDTSVSVMGLLEEIAKDRLVIMVTHNPELAHQYTNRIIELKDGKIIGDSNPYEETLKANALVEKTKKTSMSFLTAISLSISNLRTKITRTFITALAGSIGIIGIASILSLASGINLYIDDIEQETMSAYPLSIDSSGIDITSFMMGSESLLDVNQNVGDDSLPVMNSISNLFSHQNQNDLKSLRKHIESNASEINPYVKNIQYKYGLTPQIYLENESESTRQVNPDMIFQKFGIGDAGGFGMIAGGSDMGMKSFNELPSDIQYIQNQYDLVEGRWPHATNELLVVVMENGSLSDMTMYTLGLKDRTKLNEMFEDFFNQENLDLKSENKETVAYKDVIGRKFKVIQPAEKFVYDEAHQIWLDKSGDKKHMDTVIKNGMDLEVVGIIKLNDSTKTPVLSSGLYFSEKLIPALIEEASHYEIVKAQLENPALNVFTNETFENEKDVSQENNLPFESLFSIDTTKLQSAFGFDPAFSLDMGDFNINMDDLVMPEIDFEALIQSIATQVNLPIEEVQLIFNELVDDFMASQQGQDFEDIEAFLESLNAFIQADSTQQKLQDRFSDLAQNVQIAQTISDVIANYFMAATNSMMQEVAKQIQVNFQQMAQDLPNQLGSAIRFNEAAFMDSFSFNMGEEEIIALIKNLTEKNQSTQQTNLKQMGYRDLEDPTQINLYPKDFSTKDAVVEFIDDYNLSMQQTNQEEKVVKYTDLVGALMSSVTSIINLISMALVAFVSISLIVSSIMIGVITYVSVLERIKEIGILRAIGASKKDIKRVFNAETLIIGFIAGTLGIGITFILTKIATRIIYTRFGVNNIAYLTLNSALILVLISMFLAFIAGLIPAASAAKKDPVEALRSE